MKRRLPVDSLIESSKTPMDWGKRGCWCEGYRWLVAVRSFVEFYDQLLLCVVANKNAFLESWEMLPIQNNQKKRWLLLCSNRVVTGCTSTSVDDPVGGCNELRRVLRPITALCFGKQKHLLGIVANVTDPKQSRKSVAADVIKRGGHCWLY
mgnify:FL=1